MGGMLDNLMFCRWIGMIWPDLGIVSKLAFLTANLFTPIS